MDWRPSWSLIIHYGNVDELKKLSNGFSNADRADRRLGANDCHHHNGWLRPYVCQCVVTAIVVVGWLLVVMMKFGMSQFATS